MEIFVNAAQLVNLTVTKVEISENAVSPMSVRDRKLERSTVVNAIQAKALRPIVFNAVMSPKFTTLVTPRQLSKANSPIEVMALQPANDTDVIEA